MTTFLIQDTDIFADTDPGITFSEASQTWTISAGVLVSSGQDDGVFGELDAQSLFNNGTVLSAAEIGGGVEMNGDHSFVSNAAGARIIGADAGVVVDGNTASIDNKGSILGLGRIGVDFGEESANNTLNNSGSIFGRGEGVRDFSNFSGAVIHNSGLIASDSDGIEAFTADGLTTIIDNVAGGTIRGDHDSITVTAGGIALTNHGTVIGDIEADPRAVERDIIVNHGKILGDVFLGAGNDVFTGSGGTSGAVSGGGGNDRLIGGSTADKLFGGLGNDRLVGAAGNDKLDGSVGLDTLTGGAGRDQFLFDAGLDPVLNVDRITDFAVNIDKIVLDNQVFTRLGTPGLLTAAHFHVGVAAADASDRIIYNANTGFLFYDADGKGGASQVHFATLAAHLALHSADFLVAHLFVL